MKRLIRYKKNVTAVLFAMAIVATSFFSTSFVSNATAFQPNKGVEFYVNHARPSVSDNHGYIEILQRASDGTYYLSTYIWSINPNSSSSSTSASAYITLSSSSMNFNVYCSGSTSNCSYTLLEISSTGHYWWKATSESMSTDVVFGDVSAVAYHVYGDVTFGGVIGNSTSFTVYYSDDGSVTLLMDIISLLSELKSTDSSILSNVLNILNSVDGVESQLSSVISYLQSIDSELSSISSQLQSIYEKADGLLSEQKKSNTWLEKIYNKIVEALGLQGEETTEPLPDEEVDSVLEEEDALMQDTTEAENSLDFSVDSNSNNVVWNVIERVLNANPRVFGAFIGIMTLGVITLLLNR